MQCMQTQMHAGKHADLRRQSFARLQIQGSWCVPRRLHTGLQPCTHTGARLPRATSAEQPSVWLRLCKIGARPITVGQQERLALQRTQIVQRSSAMSVTFGGRQGPHQSVHSMQQARSGTLVKLQPSMTLTARCAATQGQYTHRTVYQRPCLHQPMGDPCIMHDAALHARVHNPTSREQSALTRKSHRVRDGLELSASLHAHGCFVVAASLLRCSCQLTL